MRNLPLISNCLCEILNMTCLHIRNKYYVARVYFFCEKIYCDLQYSVLSFESGSFFYPHKLFRKMLETLFWRMNGESVPVVCKIVNIAQLAWVQRILRSRARNQDVFSLNCCFIRLYFAKYSLVGKISK